MSWYRSQAIRNATRCSSSGRVCRRESASSSRLSGGWVGWRKACTSWTRRRASGLTRGGTQSEAVPGRRAPRGGGREGAWEGCSDPRVGGEGWVGEEGALGSGGADASALRPGLSEPPADVASRSRGRASKRPRPNPTTPKARVALAQARCRFPLMTPPVSRPNTRAERRGSARSLARCRASRYSSSSGSISSSLRSSRDIPAAS